MPPAAKQSPALYLFLSVAIITLLLLSALNIQNYLTPRKVLGAEIESGDRDREFWETFLSEHPDYIPGWIELGRWDKAKQIDPNFPSLQP